MFQLLKIEWLKLKDYKTFWILTGLFALFMPLFNYMFSSGMMKSGGPAGSALMSYSFPDVWSNFGFWASWFIIFIAYVIIILITNEYRYRTNRQNVIDGWSRMDFFHGKVLLVLKLAAITTIYTGIWCLVFGTHYSGGLGKASDGMIRLLYFFILCVNYYGFAMMLAFLMKRSGLVIGIFMIYILMVENILEVTLNHFYPYTGNYLPLQSSDSLIPLSVMRSGESHDTSYIIASLAYILLYYFISRWKLSKSDW